MWNIPNEAALFNEYIGKGVIDEIAARSKLSDRIEKSDKIELGGGYAKQKLLMLASQAARAASTSAYPTAQHSTPGFTLVYVKRAAMFSMQFDGLAMELAAKGGTPVDPIEFEKNGLLKITLPDKLSRQLMLDGSGHIAHITDAIVNSPTVIVDSPYYAEATKHLKVGQAIDIYSGATKKAGGVVIQSVDSDTQITLSTNINCDADSWIFDEEVYTATEGAGLGEMMGLEGIIRDTDPPVPNLAAGLQGLTVLANPEWKAKVWSNGGVKRDITEDLLTQAFDDVQGFGDITVMLTTHKIRRVWVAHLTSYKQIVNQKILWGGWAGVPFIYDGKEYPIVPDRFVPDGYLYGLSEKELTQYVTQKGKEITWEQARDGSILQKVANKNEYVAEGHIFRNLGTSIRKGFFKVVDLKEPSV
jgi:hypothetical protein